MADLKAAKITEQALGNIASGSMQLAKLSFKFSPKRTPRVYVAVRSSEEDFNEVDNIWGLSFTAGASLKPTPVLGTDIPDLFHAPELLNVVSIPSIRSLQDFVTLPNFTDIVRGDLHAPDLNEIGESLKRRWKDWVSNLLIGRISYIRKSQHRADNFPLGVAGRDFPGRRTEQEPACGVKGGGKLGQQSGVKVGQSNS